MWPTFSFFVLFSFCFSFFWGVCRTICDPHNPYLITLFVCCVWVYFSQTAAKCRPNGPEAMQLATQWEVSRVTNHRVCRQFSTSLHIRGVNRASTREGPHLRGTIQRALVNFWRQIVIPFETVVSDTSNFLYRCYSECTASFFCILFYLFWD